MSIVIKVDKVSKMYQLGTFSTGTLRRDIQRWWAISQGKEDPFIKIGEKNIRTRKGTSDVIWSLKNINFEIEEGKAVGIIGKNGAGKSTLLKILSRVTGPTEGSFMMKGRVASLLEVGTGFHPELTGRDNIYLNGAILGMRKREIQKKFDEIVEFAGVERYIDTPVKRYSSGMYVRLAFAVAAHLESEILIVDEVLAVGDAEFQKKCLGKMGDLSSIQGRTILFVSHNMESISKLCEYAFLLENGQITQEGNSHEVIKNYLHTYLKSTGSIINLDEYNKSASYNTEDIEFLELVMLNSLPSSNIFIWDAPLEFELKLYTKNELNSLVIGFTVSTFSGINVFTFNNYQNGISVGANQLIRIRITVKHNLRHGSYVLHMGALEKGKDIWWHTDIANFEISHMSDKNNYPVNNAGYVLCESNWQII